MRKCSKKYKNIYAFFSKKSNFWSHFFDIRWMKNTFFNKFLLRKNGVKTRVFIAFCAFFRDYWKIEKFLQVQNFFHIFMVAACKYTDATTEIAFPYGENDPRIYPVRLTYKKPWKCVYWGNSDENRGSIDFYTQETAFCTPFHANSTLSEISAEYHILMQCRQIMSCKCSTSFSLFIWKSHHWKNAEKV